MTERISLEGKVTVVTGAGRGLGWAYVELLAERGARVVVNDLGTDVSGFGKNSTLAEQVADLIRSRGGEAIANDSDVSTPEGGSDLIATTIEHFGRIDLLVNNAGICGSQLFEDATLDDFDQYWRVHLEWLASADTSVVHEKVDSPEMLNGHRDQVTAALRGGNITVTRDCLASA